jgi:hypothetical protein
MEKLSWSALEYEERERSRDWFWALGVIVVTASLAAAIYANYFFAALIIIAGLLIGFFAIKKPEVIEYELGRSGLKIGSRLYPYENIKSFWVQKNLSLQDPEKEELKPTLFIKSERLFMPIIGVPIDESLADRIRDMMLEQKVPEEEMREHVSEKIMEVLGF